MDTPKDSEPETPQEEMPEEAPLAASRVLWSPAHAVGHAQIDSQHQGLLAHCDLLADLCPQPGASEAAAGFDAAFEQLKTLVREHFQTEAALLAGRDDAGREGLDDELDEFEYLVEEIVTTENFDRLELQRFVSLWCLGHIAGTAPALREHFAAGAAG